MKPLKECMAATAPVKNHPPWRNGWLKEILEKKSVRSKKMNGPSLRLSLNKMTPHFKEWTTPGGVLKKHIFTKI